MTAGKRSSDHLRVVAVDGVASVSELQAFVDDAMQRHHAQHGAPQVTVDALFWAFREGGLKALDLPENQERMGRLSPAQREELRHRIKRIAKCP